MILTGKAKQDFYKFLIKNYPLNENEVKKWFMSLYNEFKNVLFIEWFDSIGIYIIISPSDNPKNWFYTILGEDILSPFYQMYQSLDDFDNRQEATEQAIKKANEIYNSK